MTHVCLSIAGFDGSGGAGIQADLKTFSALGCYGMNVLTALPVQNTCGVRRCYDIPLSCIQEQLEAIFDDIPPQAIKIGMLFSEPIITLVANFLRQYANRIPIVLDPVMVAKSSHALLQPDAISALKAELIPISTIITPNLPEGYALMDEKSPLPLQCHTQQKEQSLQKKLGIKLLTLGANAVLLKGGHASGCTADDLFIAQNEPSVLLSTERIDSKNTHGTGCTLSAAITAFLAQGKSLLVACEAAKQYLFKAIVASKDQCLGKGHGPVHHFHHWWA